MRSKEEINKEYGSVMALIGELTITNQELTARMNAALQQRAKLIAESKESEQNGNSKAQS